ncbi:hypothetical protein LP419_07605 [Massilia sp. H-1]|nr:hypothetical protein LP419_07605 [Massilia sp. H-1]
MKTATRRISIIAAMAGATGMCVAMLMGRGNTHLMPVAELVLGRAMLACMFAIAGVAVFWAIPIALIRIVSYFSD